MELLTLRSNLNHTLGDVLPLTVYTVGTENQHPITRMKGFSAHQLFLTVSGAGKFRRLGSDKDKRDTLSSGDLLFIPANYPHEYMQVSEEPWHVAYVTFVENFGGTIAGWGFREAPRLFAISDIPAFTSRIRGIWTHSGGNHNPWHTTEALISLLLHILRTNHESRPSSHPVVPVNYRESAVDIAVQFLRDHLNRPITIASLAEHVGYSQKQLTRLFLTAFGTTPLQYLHNLRMHAARMLLNEHPDLTVRQVASYVGMEPVYFTRLYKRTFQDTPSSTQRR
ncbi:helix-turn-helix domain-containing protein [Paenibacillus sp. strain BS8-2]